VATSPVTQAQRQQFEEEGFFVLENVIPGSNLETVRAELDRFIARTEAAMDAAGTDVLGLNHRGKRYFIGNRHA